MNLAELLEVPYLPNGRLATGADCYGLTRLARFHLFGRPWMPEHGAIDGGNKRDMTRAVAEGVGAYRSCKPLPGAFACAWRASLCMHMAVVVEVDGRPMILETDEPGRGCEGPRLTRIKHFESRFTRVDYYDD